MSKRNKVIICTPESDALKALRKKSGLSLRKLAERMEMSFARVHQFENGRDDISDAYVAKFLKATEFTADQWNRELSGVDHFDDLREKCHERLEEVDNAKLGFVYGLLGNL